FPLLANKPELVEKARKVFESLRQNFHVAWDERGNIGKRYYSQDEIGTITTVTVDFQTLDDNTVTLRDRDTKIQIRLNISELRGVIQGVIDGGEFPKFSRSIG
ncbi:MAG: His/Gly/Thr/Pro-type tRNA ligase C-terminal domain-containing protein, partial [bacterium]|nr:His/Gly/Thr/Pro-type tRNA ligase C-terminal domain-containing protein [bacterium]